MKSNELESLNDRELLARLRVYSNFALGDPSAVGLTVLEAEELRDSLDELESGIADLAAARAVTAAARGKRDIVRRASIRKARISFRKTRAVSGIGQNTLAAANLDPLDTIRTPAPKPSTAPIAVVELLRLRHALKIRDAGNPNSRAKPKGVLGCEIWVKIGGDPPVSEKELRYVGLATRYRYVVDLSIDDAGKRAYYRLRWVGRRPDNKGGWGETVTATISE